MADGPILRQPMERELKNRSHFGRIEPQARRTVEAGRGDEVRFIQQRVVKRISLRGRHMSDMGVKSR